MVTAQASHSYGLVTITCCISGGNTSKDHKPYKLAGLENTNNRLMPLPLPSLSQTRYCTALPLPYLKSERVSGWQRGSQCGRGWELYYMTPSLLSGIYKKTLQTQIVWFSAQSRGSLPVCATEALSPQAGHITSVPCLPVCKMGIILLTYFAGGLGSSVS